MVGVYRALRFDHRNREGESQPSYLPLTRAVVPLRSFKVCYSSTKVVVVHRWRLPCLCGNGHEAM